MAEQSTHAEDLSQLAAEQRRRLRIFLALLLATALFDAGAVLSDVDERWGTLGGMSLLVWLAVADLAVLAAAGVWVAAASRRLRTARILKRTAQA